MGFLRKTLWVSTGGLSGAVGVKANSKKDRTAKAAEAQLKLLKEQAKPPAPRPSSVGRMTSADRMRIADGQRKLREERELARVAAVEKRELPSGPPALGEPTTSRDASWLIADELEKLASLRDRGILTSEEFDERKAKLLAQ